DRQPLRPGRPLQVFDVADTDEAAALGVSHPELLLLEGHDAPARATETDRLLTGHARDFLARVGVEELRHGGGDARGVAGNRAADQPVTAAQQRQAAGKAGPGWDGPELLPPAQVPGLCGAPLAQGEEPVGIGDEPG